MNNETVPSIVRQIVDSTYQGIVQAYTLFAALALLTYASFLHFPDEVNYLWKAKFSVPTYLYFFSKYPAFLLLLVELFAIQSDLSLRLCNDIGILTVTIDILPFIGTQGLISIRTYALCQGYRPMTIALSITFLTALVSEIYCISTIRFCNSMALEKVVLFTLIHNVAIILLDTLAFIVVIHQIWGLWRLKQKLGLSSKGLTASVIQQGILRFLFVLVITTVGFLLITIPNSSDIGNDYNVFQNVLSSLLLCENTLELRRRNQQNSVPNQSALNLPVISFNENPVRSIQSALGRLHESIVTEMGERNELVNTADLGSEQNGFEDCPPGAPANLDHSEASGHAQLKRGIAESE